MRHPVPGPKNSRLKYYPVSNFGNACYHTKHNFVVKNREKEILHWDREWHVAILYKTQMKETELCCCRNTIEERPTSIPGPSRSIIGEREAADTLPWDRGRGEAPSDTAATLLKLYTPKIPRVPKIIWWCRTPCVIRIPKGLSLLRQNDITNYQKEHSFVTLERLVLYGLRFTHWSSWGQQVN